jgi:hypothetical protein
VLAAPTLADLRAAVATFSALGDVDRATRELRAATGPRVDPALPEHGEALLAWLNAWGCRIRLPRPGEPTPFQDGLAGWWAEWGGTLPRSTLAQLRDPQVERLGEAHASLAALTATGGPRPRTLSSTAAAKTLFALRPRTVVPWDAAIAVALHGARDGNAFARHQRLGREWAMALLDETGLAEPQLAVAAGRPGASLAKLIDEYCYVRITYAMRSA